MGRRVDPVEGLAGVVLFHGGVAGKNVGDILRPSPPKATDNCPVCVARRAGRVLTFGEYRRWAIISMPPSLERDKLLASMEDAPDDAPVDPPSAVVGVYMTSERIYARWYAARSDHGDLYRVVPVGPHQRSTEDTWPTWVAPEARVVEVLERGVWLRRRDRRELNREWARRDRRAGVG